MSGVAGRRRMQANGLSLVDLAHRLRHRTVVRIAEVLNALAGEPGHRPTCHADS